MQSRLQLENLDWRPARCRPLRPNQQTLCRCTLTHSSHFFFEPSVEWCVCVDFMKGRKKRHTVRQPTTDCQHSCRSPPPPPPTIEIQIPGPRFTTLATLCNKVCVAGAGLRVTGERKKVRKLYIGTLRAAIWWRFFKRDFDFVWRRCWEESGVGIWRERAAKMIGSGINDATQGKNLFALEGAVNKACRVRWSCNGNGKLWSATGNGKKHHHWRLETFLLQKKNLSHPREFLYDFSYALPKNTGEWIFLGFFVRKFPFI